MPARTIVLIAIVAAVAAAGVWAVWMLRYRPLTVFAWQTRLALRTSGLHKVLVAAPAGPQTVFAGGGGPVLVLLHGAGGISPLPEFDGKLGMRLEAVR